MVQSKLSYIKLPDNKTSVEFAYSIVETRLKLKNMGVSDDMVSKDIHCRKAYL